MTLPLWLSLLQLNTLDIPQAIVCSHHCAEWYAMVTAELLTITLSSYCKRVAQQFMRLLKHYCINFFKQ